MFILLSTSLAHIVEYQTMRKHEVHTGGLHGKQPHIDASMQAYILVRVCVCVCVCACVHVHDRHRLWAKDPLVMGT